MSPAQKSDIGHVWGAHAGDFDYVTGWFKKAVDYFANTSGGRFAFVSTNSITQGKPVAELFQPIFNAGWRIRFAHQTFVWTSEAPNAASVHCVVTGFDKGESSTPTLYGYRESRGEPTAVPVKSINAYLVDGPNIFATRRSLPLSPELPPMRAGSMPNDAGHLIVSPDEYDTAINDEVAATYLRPFRMGRELINNIDRWCLWLVDASPSEIRSSPFVSARIAAVRDARAASNRVSTQKLAATPHLFGENHQPPVAYLAVPRVFSERRSYATAVRLGPDVIAGDKVYTCPDEDGFAFAIISSSMFIVWQKTIGGRLKSDPSFSNTVVWNTLPLPLVTEKIRSEIIEAGKGVQAARDLHPNWSLADHYSPLGMTPELLKAHRALDRVVDKALGARKAMHTMEDRQAVLFQRYAEMTSTTTR